MDEAEIRSNIYTTFANTAAGLGYSEVHGRIMACLLIHDGPVPLATIARETGYSPSMISLSLDFLESIDMIKRVKKHGDRRLFVQMKGDLMSGLRRAIQMRLAKAIGSSKEEFERYRKEARKLPDEEREALLHQIDVLENEVKRFSRYVVLLSRIKPS